MEDLFHSYWWLLFPLGWILASAFSSFLNYRRHQKTLDLIKVYAERGQEPPSELLKVLDKAMDPEAEFFAAATRDSSGKPATARTYWSLFGLFAMMAIGFGAAAYFGDVGKATWPFAVVAMTMAAVAAWSLINAVLLRKPKS